MKRRSSILMPILSLALLIVVLYKIDAITDYTTKLINPIPEVVLNDANEYYIGESYSYVQSTDNFVPYSRQDIMNIFYSFLDRGYDNLTIYCPSEYGDCLNDITSIINDQTTITDIGNFVHPYNNFHDVHLVTSSTGEVNIQINKTYSDSEIKAINSKLDAIEKEIYTDEMKLEDKILAAHDYIIDHTSYDVDGSDTLNAYDLFTNGKAKCFGYADAMDIMLYRLGVKTYKVGSNEHVWNLAYLDNEWSHIDVTWDDPVVEGSARLTDKIRHKFYMIDADTLLSYDTKEHNFNKNIYAEAK